MTIQISGWLGIIVTSLGIISLLVTLFAFTRASYAKADNERLLQSNEILRQNAKDIEDELKRIKQEKSDTDKEHTRKILEVKTLLEAEAEKVKVLQDLVTGKEELESIKSTLIEHDEKVQQRHEVLIDHIDAFLTRLPEIKT
jgi:hypothetical protein